MTSVSARSHVSAMKVLTLPPGTRRLTDPQTFAEMKKMLEEEQRVAQRIREEGPRRLAEQDAVKVHTVFKVAARSSARSSASSAETAGRRSRTPSAAAPASTTLRRGAG